MFVDAAAQAIRRETGGSIVMSTDSGPGDALQFARYGGLLKEQGARVILECRDERVRLPRQADGVDEVVALGQLPEAGDASVPMRNLIGAFRTTLKRAPVSVPYVHIDPLEAAAWRERLASHTGMRVSLYRDDRPKQWRHLRRSVAVEQMLTSPEQPGPAYFSLRKGLETPTLGLTDWSSELKDLAVTAMRQLRRSGGRADEARPVLRYRS